MPFLTGWTYRQKITIDQTKIDATLTNFPVLVKLTESNFDFSHLTYQTAEDIRFTASDGTTLLDFEREFHDEIPESYGSDFFTGGTASASSTNGGEVAANAFDDNTGSFWTSQVAAGMPQTLQYDLGSGVTKTARQYTVTCRKSGDTNGVPDAWTFEGSNNGSSWTTIHTVSGESWSDDGPKTYQFANSTAYRYYRLNISSTATDSYVQIKEFEAMEINPASNVGYYWVEIPSISSSVDTDFYIYYGNTTSGLADGANPTGVWDSNHKGVWHLTESGNGTTDEFKDSTSYANHGTGQTSAVPTVVDGKIYKAQDFNSQRINVDDDSDLEPGSSSLTLSLKVKFDTLSGNQCLIGRDTNGNSYLYLALESGDLRFRDYNSGDIVNFQFTPSISANVWYDLELENDGGNWRFWIDNTQLGTDTADASAILDRAEGWIFGGQPTINYPLNGKLDEIRFSIGVARGAAWRKARINSDNDTLVTFDVEETAGVQTEDVSFTIVSDVTNTAIQIFAAQNLSFTITSTITESDSVVLPPGGPADYGSKILSFNPLIFVTNTNPANIVKADISDPENISWETEEIVGVVNLIDAIIDTTNEYVYAIGDNALIVKVNINDLSDQEIIDIDDTDNLLNIDIDDDNGLIYISTDSSVGELYVLDIRNTFIGDSDLQVLAQLQFKGDSDFNCINGFIGDCDCQILSEETFIGDCDFKCLTTVLDNITPIDLLDHVVYLDGVALSNTDIDLSSIRITHTVDEKSTATFKLNRRHDNPNYNPEGALKTITSQNTIRIEIDGRVVFPQDGVGTARIAQISPQYDNSDQINILAKSDDVPEYRYNKIQLSLPSFSERLGLYEVLIHNTQIVNEYIDPDEENPVKYKGIKVDLGTKIVQNALSVQDMDTFGRIAEGIKDGTFKAKQNWNYFWSPVVKRIGNYNISVDASTSEPDSSDPFHSIRLPVFKFGGVTPFDNIATGDTTAIYFAYIGTSLSPVSEDLWFLKNARHRRQRIMPNKEYDLGDYTVGDPPYAIKTPKNGILIPTFKWEDGDDGLYHVYDQSYNYVDYAKRVADLEYQLLLNINGEIAPDTSCNLTMTVDCYLFHNLHILNRINIDNTVQSGIFKNNNGFPVSIKSITIDASTRKVTINADNKLSKVEMEEIYSQFPDDEDPLYLYPERRKLILPKSDMNTRLRVD